MRIRMVQDRSGPRHDDRMWPPRGGEIDVTDDEGAAVCGAGWAVPVVQDTEPPVEYRDGVPSPPGFRDPKQAWVDHAIAQGADPAEAAAMSRNALVDTYRTTPKR